MKSFDFIPRTRVVFGEKSLQQLGRLARELGFHRSLLVADQGLVKVGHTDLALEVLRREGIESDLFDDFEVDPDTVMIERGLDFARSFQPDSIVGLGGGSSLDCAKGINFLLTNGGRMEDFVGYGKARTPLLPMIGIPTTAGTGSEAQSYAVIAQPTTHLKMACGDPKAAFHIAILDPALTVSQPFSVTAASGYDALSHAVETYVSTARTPLSESFSREAWRLLKRNYERVLTDPFDLRVRAKLQLGAYWAGLAIECSMLGAAHACANPLSARYGLPHGVAIALLLPQVVRWNGSCAGAGYRDLLAIADLSLEGDAGENLARHLEEMARAGDLPTRLQESRVGQEDLAELAQQASQQWTARFNPRLLDRQAALQLYQRAL